MVSVKSASDRLDWTPFYDHYDRIERSGPADEPQLATLAAAIEHTVEAWKPLPLGFRAAILDDPLKPDPFQLPARREGWTTHIQAAGSGLADGERVELRRGLNDAGVAVRDLTVRGVAQPSQRRLLERIVALRDGFRGAAPQIEPDPLDGAAVSRFGLSEPSVLEAFEPEDGQRVLRQPRGSPAYVEQAIMARLMERAALEPDLPASQENLLPDPPWVMQLMHPTVVTHYVPGQQIPLARRPPDGPDEIPSESPPEIEWLMAPPYEPVRQGLRLRWFGGLVEIALRGCRVDPFDDQIAAIRAIYGAALGATEYGDLNFGRRLEAWVEWADRNEPRLARVVRAAVSL